jgi:hypothetical protein
MRKIKLSGLWRNTATRHINWEFWVGSVKNPILEGRAVLSTAGLEVRWRRRPRPSANWKPYCVLHLYDSPKQPPLKSTKVEEGKAIASLIPESEFVEIAMARITGRDLPSGPIAPLSWEDRRQI